MAIVHRLPASRQSVRRETFGTRGKRYDLVPLRRHKDEAGKNRILAGRGFESRRGVDSVDSGRETTRVRCAIGHDRGANWVSVNPDGKLSVSTVPGGFLALFGLANQVPMILLG